jgi:uncharacterized protein (DUF1778 family)
MENQNNKKRNPERTALLICCTREEAERIREAAKRERRSISGFVMNAIQIRFSVESRIQEGKRRNG